jgi:hypothetical protein
MPFFVELVRRIEALLVRDRAYLVDLVGRVPDGPSGGITSASASGGPGSSIVPPPTGEPN